jgi:hypothetical protein
MLDSAIEGLTMGYMDYSIDPVLPIALSSSRNALKEVNNYSNE